MKKAIFIISAIAIAHFLLSELVFYQAWNLTIARQGSDTPPGGYETLLSNINHVLQFPLGHMQEGEFKSWWRGSRGYGFPGGTNSLFWGIVLYMIGMGMYMAITRSKTYDPGTRDSIRKALHDSLAPLSGDEGLRNL